MESQKFKSSSAHEVKRGAGRWPPRGLNKTQIPGRTRRNESLGEALQVELRKVEAALPAVSRFTWWHKERQLPLI